MKTEKILLALEGFRPIIWPYPHEGSKPHKFLYYKDTERELLLVADKTVPDHRQLAEFYTMAGGTVSRETLAGAGKITAEGAVLWGSMSFPDLETGSDAGRRIRELLALP